VAADWHELMIPQRTTWPSLAHISKQLDPRFAASRRTTAPISLHPVARKLLLYVPSLPPSHTRLTNSYLLKGESQPVCEACYSPLTVKHILVDCTRYSAARHRYFGVDTLKDVFENVASWNIIAYVKDINFYNRIQCCFYISSIALILTSF